MSDWYDNYRKKIAEAAANVKPVDEVGQNILMMKSVGSEAFENGTDMTTFRTIKGGVLDHIDAEMFGFTEHMVNQLMQYAYDCGSRDIEKKSYDAGFNACWQGVLDNLGIEEKEDE